MLGVFREDLAFSNAPKHCYYEPWVLTRLTKKLAIFGSQQMVFIQQHCG